jgi:hypothetical protein
LGFTGGPEPPDTYDAGIGQGELLAVDWLLY